MTVVSRKQDNGDAAVKQLSAYGGEVLRASYVSGAIIPCDGGGRYESRD